MLRHDANAVKNMGGTSAGEEYLPGPGGGRKGSNFVDLTVEKNGKILSVQTVNTLSDGKTHDSRERKNAASIRRKTPGDHLLLIPKD